jgi:hypothetical protein
MRGKGVFQKTIETLVGIFLQHEFQFRVAQKGVQQFFLFPEKIHSFMDIRFS